MTNQWKYFLGKQKGKPSKWDLVVWIPFNWYENAIQFLSRRRTKAMCSFSLDTSFLYSLLQIHTFITRLRLYEFWAIAAACTWRQRLQSAVTFSLRRTLSHDTSINPSASQNDTKNWMTPNTARAEFFLFLFFLHTTGLKNDFRERSHGRWTIRPANSQKSRHDVGETLW